ncbi:MAG: UDP-N-acetylmuramate--L-alanine ligase [marine benthic group bacterium]|nr:UDP-N-acetylmuramate--L-alanine ligase [Gemmatimonadota bacterium]
MFERRPPDRSHLPAAGASVYLLGIAGAGMTGLARILAAEGYGVVGSDLLVTPETRRLEAHGIRFVDSDDMVAPAGVELVVHTSAAPDDHPVLQAARNANVPVLKRARAMGALLNDRRLVAIAGTHGKTTVTAMTARVAEAGGLDPLVLVGGRVQEWDGNARIGSGVAIAEADEYDRSFLELSPSLAVITSVEPEHLECYEGPEHLRSSFREFAGRAADRDGILACAEGPGVDSVVEGLRSVATYGLDPAADFRVAIMNRSETVQTCRLETGDESFAFDLGAPGDHNAQNAGAALAVGLRLGVDTQSLREALAGFSGVDRRLQRLGDRGGRVILDDYAHHPTEVHVSVAAVRDAWPGRRLAVVFQPHLYSRTQQMAAEFAEALTAADEALVLPIYPAREAPIPGVTARLVTDASSGFADTVTADEIPGWVDGLPTDSVVLFMGAGDITLLAHRVAEGKGENGVGL